MKKRIVVITIALLMLLAGCAAPTTTEDATDSGADAGTAEDTTEVADTGDADTDVETEPLKFATMIMYDNEFFKTMEAGMIAEAEKNGVELSLNNALNKIDKEVEICSNIANQDFDALVLHPIDSTASIPAIQSCYDAGMPVYICGTTLNADFPIGSCESDHYNLGQQTGIACREFIEENFDGVAQIAIFEFSTQIPEMSAKRTQGFLDEVEKLEGVEIVSRQDAWTNEMAVASASEVINANPDLKIIWSANEGGTVGSTMAVKNSGKEGEIFVFGTDVGKQVANLLLDPDNILQFCTGQGAFNMGVTAIQDTLKYLNGEEIEAKIIDPILLSRDDPDAINAYLEELVEQIGD